jgi:hypothetical protein
MAWSLAGSDPEWSIGPHSGPTAAKGCDGGGDNNPSCDVSHACIHSNTHTHIHTFHA